MNTLTMYLPIKSLIIPVAVPGSGKSTLLRFIEEGGGEVLKGFRIGADDVRERMFGEVSVQGDPRLVHTAAQALIEVRLAAGLPSAYDATNVTQKARKPLLDLAAKYNYHVVGLISDVPVEVAKDRNANRTVGQVPEFVID